MISAVESFYTLQSERSSLVLDCRSGKPVILYWGARLQGATTPQMLALLDTRQELPASAADEAPIALSPELGAGFEGSAGVLMHRAGQHWGVHAAIEAVDVTANALSIRSRCAATEISLEHYLVLDPDSDVLAATTAIINEGAEPLWLERCAAPAVPLPLHLDQILGFEGRWAHEFQTHRVPRFRGAYLRENHSGRTSHGSFPGVILHGTNTTESDGEARGFHLGWSGNHRVLVEELASGRALVQLGELFHPGELSLAPGERYSSPTLYGARSDAGLSGLSQCFHRHVRKHLRHERARDKPRPVHFNSWEAVYFDLSEDVLRALAAEAAAVGVERFVLDDGWFRNRRSDRSGLGDWYVDEVKFPHGLGPLIENVRGLGMEFGLWIEPEMVNPDSDLYRAHPDWVLHADPAPRMLARHQLVLDLTRHEVTEYLFERIDALLRDHEIAYLKWDMNRALHQPGDGDGRAATHRQTHALYALLARVRAAHPQVEIESCASGGGRADYGILAHTDRIWTSDSNDALDRLRIQRGFSLFFPPELMGAHVGPECCHITGRRLRMATRAGVALLGAMGIEANLLEMASAEKAELKDAVALYQEHRELIGSGDLLRLDLPAWESGLGVAAPDRAEALFSYALLASQPHGALGRLRLRGLDADAVYSLTVIWPHGSAAPVLDVVDDARVSGEALMQAGVQLPLLQPESLLLLHLRRV